MANSGPLYQVGGIIGRKEVTGRTFYKVHWAGYGSDQDSWEPEDNLANCKMLLDMFNANQDRRVTRSSSKARELIVSSSDDDDFAKVVEKTSVTTPRIKRQSRRSNIGSATKVNSPTVTKSLAQAKKSATSPRRSKVTTHDLTPSQYYLRFSTIKQRPPLHSSQEIKNKFVQQASSTVAHDDKIASAVPSLPMAHSHPSWMNLGMAEMLLCLVMLALVIASLGYLQYNLKTTFSNP